MQRTLKAAIAAAVLAAASASAPAANVSFTGTLAGDNDVMLFSFTLAADANVTLRTLSYAGGVNAAGSPIADGGFDPVIALFAGSGNSALLIDGDDDGGPDLDALLQLSPLLAGTYTVALSQVANFANGPTLGDGFLGLGDPGFGGRSSAWALDILGVDTANAIPEPATLALALFGLVAAAGLGRSRVPG
jgi:hypothetical protein